MDDRNACGEDLCSESVRGLNEPELSRTLSASCCCSSAEKWRITVQLYSLTNPKHVYQFVVKHRFPAAFIDPAMFSGNLLDLQIAAAKALTRQSRNVMIAKSLPMEFLYALSPRTGISDALKTFGFKATLSSVLVVWIHQEESPPSDQLSLFHEIIHGNGQQIPLEDIRQFSHFRTLAEVYEFPPIKCEDDRKLLEQFITSKIAIKE